MSGRSSQEAQKKVDRRKPRKSSRPTFRGFVSHTLTAADKKEFLQYELTESFEEELLPALLGEGYRLSFSADLRDGAFMAAISTKDEGDLNHGLVLTARAGVSAFQAGMRAIFLHQVVFGGEWPDPSDQAEYQDEWEVEQP